MADPNLINYIWNYLNQGYTAQAIRSALIGQGYPAQQVDEAFAAVASNGKTTPKHSHLPLIIMAVVVLLAIGMSAAYFLLQQDITPDPVSELKPTPIKNTTQPIKNATPVKNTTQNPIQVPIQTDPAQNTPSKPTPQDRTSLSRLEIEEKVNELAKSDPAAAIRYCPQIVTLNGENECYTRVAIVANQPRLCTYATTDKTKDFCYMQFAIAGQGTKEICDMVSNDFRKESCHQLLSFQEVSKQEAPQLSPEQQAASYTAVAFVDEPTTPTG